jgi:flagellum-specific ATP synthase
VFARLPQLVERAGMGVGGRGSITAFYTVLTEGDDNNDPVADNARAILDGHIVLSRRLAERGQYPAIDIEASISRLMTAVAAPEHYQLARQFKHYYSLYEQNQDLFNVGAYQPGSNPELDRAVQLRDLLTAFMRQDPWQPVASAQAIEGLAALFQRG